MKTILFVCTANMCRSPMAEGLMQRKLEREGRANEICAASAGAWTEDGHPTSENAILEMAARNINIAGHLSRALTEEMVKDAALVLTMTRSHAEAIRAEFRKYAKRIHSLAEMAGRSYDVDDPISGTREDYHRTAQEIEELIEQGYARMIKLVNPSTCSNP